MNFNFLKSIFRCVKIERKWILRKFNKGDIEHFLDWRKLVARREKTKEYFEWESFNGPWGPAETWLAVDGDTIVGQYSTQRYEAFYFGEKLMASLSFDTGTHPDYRRQGIFKTIGDHHFKEEGLQNIHFSTGFPNENFWPGGKKFGWHALCLIPLLGSNKFFNINIKASSSFEIKEIKKFDNEFKGFSENFKDQISIYLNRTQEYLNWRFVDKPNLKEKHYIYSKFKILDKTGEMVSYLVIKFFQSNNQNILHLVDFLSPIDENIYQTILSFLIDIAKANNIEMISMFLNRYHSFNTFLRKFGFQHIETNRVYIVRKNNDVLDKDILFDEKNHYMTMGDSDVI